MSFLARIRRRENGYILLVASPYSGIENVVSQSHSHPPLPAGPEQSRPPILRSSAGMHLGKTSPETPLLLNLYLAPLRIPGAFARNLFCRSFSQRREYQISIKEP